LAAPRDGRADERAAAGRRLRPRSLRSPGRRGGRRVASGPVTARTTARVTRVPAVGAKRIGALPQRGVDLFAAADVLPAPPYRTHRPCQRPRPRCGESHASLASPPMRESDASEASIGYLAGVPGVPTAARPVPGLKCDRAPMAPCPHCDGRVPGAKARWFSLGSSSSRSSSKRSRTQKTSRGGLGRHSKGHSGGPIRPSVLRHSADAAAGGRRIWPRDPPYRADPSTRTLVSSVTYDGRLSATLRPQVQRRWIGGTDVPRRIGAHGDVPRGSVPASHWGVIRRSVVPTRDA
jgi:hypothetical protein